MKFSQEAWSKNQDVYKEILGCSFYTELLSGSLSKEKFNYFVDQDLIYLKDYGEAATILADRSIEAGKNGQADFLFKLAQMTRDSESSMLAALPDYAPSGAQADPATLVYTSFLLKSCSEGELENGLASLLPCPWIYYQASLEFERPPANHPYYAWLEFYQDPTNEELVNEMREVIDFAAEKVSMDTYQKMLESFRVSSEMELLFWNNCYGLGGKNLNIDIAL